LFKEFLAAETGIDRHHANQINFMNDVLKRLNGGMGIDSDPGFAARVPDLLNIALQMRASLNVNGNIRGTSPGKCFHVTLGLHDHKMNIKRSRSMPADRLDDRESHGYIGNKDAVHDINMDPIRFAVIDHTYLIGKVGEVCG